VAATISIDGTDVTGVAIEGSSTRRLNRPSTAQVKIPMQESIGGVGSLLKISFNGNLHHHGRVLLCETDTGEDTGYTVYNSTDPMELWDFRPVRGDDCGFMPQAGESIIDDYVTGPQIVKAMLLNSMGDGVCNHADCIDADRQYCEGPLFLDVAGGTWETGGADLTGAPVDWPMTIMELTSLLISSGCLDVVITPTDPGGGVMGTVSGYNGDYGTDLSGSVVFDYGQGNFNVSRLRWNEDMTNMCNKLWYFMGPRVQSAGDPAGDQHWCYNVQGDDPCLPNPIPNGASVFTLLANRLASRSTYGTRMEIQIFDATADDCVPEFGCSSTEKELYRRRWETEQWIRMQPRELIHITPTRETEIGGFDIGDIVGVSASSAVRGGFSGAQRVYEYTISWDNDGVLALSELQTSPTSDA
jgi:hypothetical protein